MSKEAWFREYERSEAEYADRTGKQLERLTDEDYDEIAKDADERLKDRMADEVDGVYDSERDREVL